MPEMSSTNGVRYGTPADGNGDVSRWHSPVPLPPAGANVCSGTVDLVFIQAQACFDYNISLFLGSYAPYGALSASAGADVSVQTWNASPWYEPWKWSWGSWHTWGISVGASVQIDPFKVCVDVMGANLCA